MPKKIEYCQYCKSDIKDRANWCKECLDKKADAVRKKKRDDNEGQETLFGIKKWNALWRPTELHLRCEPLTFAGLTENMRRIRQWKK